MVLFTCWWGRQGSGRLNNWPKVTQLMSEEVGTWTHTCLTTELLLLLLTCWLCCAAEAGRLVWMAPAFLSRLTTLQFETCISRHPQRVTWKIKKTKQNKKETLSPMPDAKCVISSIGTRKLNGQWSVGEWEGPWRTTSKLVAKWTPSPWRFTEMPPIPSI